MVPASTRYVLLLFCPFGSLGYMHLYINLLILSAFSLNILNWIYLVSGGQGETNSLPTKILHLYMIIILIYYARKGARDGLVIIIVMLCSRRRMVTRSCDRPCRILGNRLGHVSRWRLMFVYIYIHFHMQHCSEQTFLWHIVVSESELTFLLLYQYACCSAATSIHMHACVINLISWASEQG